MTPDRYEREFHLPAGHATSFAGGPLAALRNRNPELTRYRHAPSTACTSPARRRSRAPACGAPAAATRAACYGACATSMTRGLRPAPAAQHADRHRDRRRSRHASSLGRVAGIPFRRCHWSVVLIAGVLLGANLAQVFGASGRGRSPSSRFLALDPRPRGRPCAAWHAATASRTASIQLWALGGVARLDRESPSATCRGMDRRGRSAHQPRHRRRRRSAPRSASPRPSTRRGDVIDGARAGSVCINVAARRVQPAARGTRSTVGGSCSAWRWATPRRPLPRHPRGGRRRAGRSAGR